MSTGDFSIFEEDYRAVRMCLKRLLETTNAIGLLLVDRAGQLITAVGDLFEMDVESIASLCASEFTAAYQMAYLFGEGRLSSLFQKGEELSCYAQVVGPKVILVVIFNDRTPLGLVRAQSAHTEEKLAGLFGGIFDKLQR